ncbi:MAG: methyltransferase [Rhizobacter sp.]|nr:methyltransferase [Rhizobacter sp.]
MKISRQGLLRGALAASLVCAVAACAVNPPSSSSAALSSQRIGEIVASPDRTAADRTNDMRRKPAEMLDFIGIRPGMVALDVSAGGGYTTELLARSVGPTGAVYGQSPPRDPNRMAPRPAAPEGGMAAPAPMPPMPAPPRSAGGPLADREARLRSANVAAAPIVAVPQRFEDPVPAALANAQLDLVTLMFNYHDLGFLGVDRAQMNRAIFGALKPGGIYVIADHAGRPGTGISESGTLHRIEEAFLRREVESAGFVLASEGSFLRNPADPRDQNTPNPPQPKDEFVLKFVKP